MFDQMKRHAAAKTVTAKQTAFLLPNLLAGLLIKTSSPNGNKLVNNPIAINLRTSA
jgi:hypothetical protein